MAKIAALMTYHIETNTDMEFFYEGKAFPGVFTMTVVGGEADGRVVCAGPGEMGQVLMGMMRLAAHAHALLRDDPEQLHEVLVGHGENTANNEGQA